MRALPESKLKQNALRRERAQFLAGLPERFHAGLASARVLTSEESEGVLAKRYISEAGLGYPKAARPAGYWYSQFNQLEHALAALAVFPNQFDHLEGFLHLGTSDLVFRVPFGWARENFGALCALAGNHAWLATESLGAGIAVGHFIGYLEPDPNPDEIVFEAARWHAA